MQKRVAAAALAAALMGSVSAADGAPAPAPQVADPAGDANFTANASQYDRTAPVGNQDYADVLSILWQVNKKNVKVGRRTVPTVTGLTVTLTLAAPPKPPAPTSLVYRVLADAPCGENLFFGVVYYTDPSSDKTIPQSAIRDNCTGATRLTPIAMPAINGNTITWTVPMTAIPKDTKVKVGSTLRNFYFSVNEIEDFRGNCLPDDGGTTGYGKACGLGFGVVDNSRKQDVKLVIG